MIMLAAAQPPPSGSFSRRSRAVAASPTHNTWWRSLLGCKHRTNPWGLHTCSALVFNRTETEAAPYHSKKTSKDPNGVFACAEATGDQLPALQQRLAMALLLNALCHASLQSFRVSARQPSWLCLSLRFHGANCAVLCCTKLVWYMSIFDRPCCNRRTGWCLITATGRRC